MKSWKQVAKMAGSGLEFWTITAEKHVLAAIWRFLCA